ncbi:hypothetical protein [Phocaeicola coprocola]|jgi:hypothetical protein BACCOPRO_03214|uniref:hypothetical protein n=1 Tax=Phocaeicola coprocola TaxID=310298 RepID=UPI0026658B77|nr:hypothetical protein [Phocaeicola coprocola]
MVEGKSELEEIGDLSNKEKIALQRRYVLHCKYEEAVEMYADSKLPLCKIAVKCNVSLGGLGSYLRRYWRELILRRRGISYEGKDPKDIKIVSSGQPSIVSKAKYAEAVEACKSLEYIDLNVSQVARKFNVNGTALANYMRLHYEEIPIWRENVRRMLGIGDNVHRGVRPECEEQYVLAVEMYKSTDKTIPEIAEICQVSIGGLSQHMRFYHKEVIRKRKAERKAAKKNRIIGKICGNGQIHCPQQKTVEKYREALELYKNSNLIIKEIVRKTGVPLEGFRNYLRVWHRDLMLERRGGEKVDCKEVYIDLAKTKCYLKSTAAKYGAAIDSMKNNLRPVTQVAAEYGLNADTFRSYLWEHEPDLVSQCGMVKNENGKYTSRQAMEKYAEAVRLYETTTTNLKSIAERLGVVYNSLSGYIRRNCPDAKQKHEELVRKEMNL